MHNPEQPPRPTPVCTAELTLFQRALLLLRGFGPLFVAGLAVLTGPTLLTWWLFGGPFHWYYALIGGVVSVGLLGIIRIALGWAIGRLLRSRRQ